MQVDNAIEKTIKNYGSCHQKKFCKILIRYQYLHLIKKQDYYSKDTYLFQFQYHKTLKFLYPFLYVEINITLYNVLLLFV